VVGPAKNRLLRDFRRRLVFDFCNTIPRKADVDEPICHVGYGPIEELTDNFTALFNVLT
jgi:hypothetical protein